MKTLSLPLPDQRFLSAAEGWLGLGDYLAANEELENNTPKLKPHPYVLEMRWKINSKSEKWELAAEMARALLEHVSIV